LATHSRVPTRQVAAETWLDPRTLLQSERRSANEFADETLRDGETARDVGGSHCPDSLVRETHADAGDGGDVRRMAHNPEVEGSNPSPATKMQVRGPIRTRMGPLACGLCTDLSTALPFGRSGRVGSLSVRDPNRSALGAVVVGEVTEVRVVPHSRRLAKVPLRRIGCTTYRISGYSTSVTERLLYDVIRALLVRSGLRLGGAA
jgi:hypothetical protein